eukprot:3439959-Prymnesium_polylepis.1
MSAGGSKAGRRLRACRDVCAAARTTAYGAQTGTAKSRPSVSVGAATSVSCGASCPTADAPRAATASSARSVSSSAHASNSAPSPSSP